MRVLLQHKKTGLFFVSEGCWAGFRGDARHFRSVVAAMVVAWRHRLKDAMVVFAFGEDLMDVCVSVWEGDLGEAAKLQGLETAVPGP
jgi:hypothetical protein